MTTEMDYLKKENKELQTENDALKARIAELEAKSKRDLYVYVPVGDQDHTQPLQIIDDIQSFLEDVNEQHDTDFKTLDAYRESSYGEYGTVFSLLPPAVTTEVKEVKKDDRKGFITAEYKVFTVFKVPDYLLEPKENDTAEDGAIGSWCILDDMLYYTDKDGNEVELEPVNEYCRAGNEEALDLHRPQEVHFNEHFNKLTQSQILAM